MPDPARIIRELAVSHYTRARLELREARNHRRLAGFLSEADREDAQRFVRVARVGRGEAAGAIVVDLPVDTQTIEIERAEVVLNVRVTLPLLLQEACLSLPAALGATA